MGQNEFVTQLSIDNAIFYICQYSVGEIEYTYLYYLITKLLTSAYSSRNSGDWYKPEDKYLVWLLWIKFSIYIFFVFFKQSQIKTRQRKKS